MRPSLTNIHTMVQVQAYSLALFTSSCFFKSQYTETCVEHHRHICQRNDVHRSKTVGCNVNYLHLLDANILSKRHKKFLRWNKLHQQLLFYLGRQIDCGSVLATFGHLQAGGAFTHGVSLHRHELATLRHEMVNSMHSGCI